MRKNSKMDWLDKERAELDILTRQIVKLLRQRRKKSLKIQNWKKKNGLPKTDSKQESKILQKHSRGLGSVEAIYIKSVLARILKATKS